MRIAVVHSFYRSSQPSGENIAVRQQVDALRAVGIEILEVYRYTDEEAKAPLYKIRSALGMATGVDRGHPERAIADFRADVVHVHNTSPNFGTRWLARLPMPVVTTLHNFRVSCANGLLYRDGHVCVDCPASGSHSAFVHACYQGSRAASLPAAIALIGGVSSNRLINASAAVITQSSRVQSFMIDQGVPQSRLRLIPGFVEERHSAAAPAPRTPRFVFVGRASPEKGLTELLDIWPSTHPLDVVGAEDPGHPDVTRAANAHFLGIRDREWIVQQLPNYTALVFPGRVWEGAYPLVVREALESGVPVVSLSGSSAADLVQEAGVGAVYEDGDRDGLVRALDLTHVGGDALRSACRGLFQAAFTEARWRERTQDVYESVLGV